MKKASNLILLLLVLTSSACSNKIDCLTEDTDESRADITEDRGWEATIHLAEISPNLSFWGTSILPGVPIASDFMLDDSDNAFLLLTLSLVPIGEDNTLCLHDLVITNDDSVSFFPIGIDPEGNPANSLSNDKGFGTSGACDIEQATSISVNINCDLVYDANNNLGIIQKRYTDAFDVRSREFKWSNELPVTEATVFYVLPIETIEAGGLMLKLASSETIELPPCYYRPTVYTMGDIGGAVQWCHGDGRRGHFELATIEAELKAADPE